jgi:hypothetical protein
MNLELEQLRIFFRSILYRIKLCVWSIYLVIMRKQSVLFVLIGRKIVFIFLVGIRLAAWIVLKRLASVPSASKVYMILYESIQHDNTYNIINILSYYCIIIISLYYYIIIISLFYHYIIISL